MVREDIQIRKARKMVVPGTTRNNTGIPDIPDIVQQEQPPAAVGYNTSIPLLVCAEYLPENENASNEVTSNIVTDECTSEYTDENDTEEPDSSCIDAGWQQSPNNPENWDPELSSSSFCVIQEMTKLKTGD